MPTYSQPFRAVTGAILFQLQGTPQIPLLAIAKELDYKHESFGLNVF